MSQSVDRDAGNGIQILSSLAIPEMDPFAMREGNRLAGVCVHQVRHGVWLTAIKPLFKKLKNGCCPELYVQGKYNLFINDLELTFSKAKGRQDVGLLLRYCRLLCSGVYATPA